MVELDKGYDHEELLLLLVLTSLDVVLVLPGQLVTDGLHWVIVMVLVMVEVEVVVPS